MVSSVLDLLGSLLVILGIAWLVAAWSVPASFIAAGVLVLLLSLVIDWRHR